MDVFMLETGVQRRRRHRGLPRASDIHLLDPFAATYYGIIALHPPNSGMKILLIPRGVGTHLISGGEKLELLVSPTNEITPLLAYPVDMI